jgi:hypothetical protein
MAELVLHSDKDADMSYTPSYRLDGGDDLGDEHRRIGELVAGVPGMLRPEDELKLYELAYFAPGPILEIGTYRGRSTTIMARAAQAGSGAMLVSVDVDPEAQRTCAAALSAHGVAGRVVLVRGSAAALARRFRGLSPSLTFVDADHSLDGVRRDLAALEPIVPRGGLVLFHDYQEAHDDDPAVAQIAVKNAVQESWVSCQCDFAGLFGCCGLFRRREGGPEAAGGPTVHAVWRDSPRMQYLQRVRWPLGRLARRVLGRPRV